MLAEALEAKELSPRTSRICTQLRMFAAQIELVGEEAPDGVDTIIAALFSTFRVEPRDPNIVQIVRNVADALHVNVQALRSKRRDQHTAFVRFQAMYLIRELTGLSYPKIGYYFGKDHSTVIHGHNLIAARMQRDQVFAQSMRKLGERAKVGA